MAAVPTSELPDRQKQELLCTYAALILSDEKIDISVENIQKLVTASGNTVEPYMPMLFARALDGHNIPELLSCAGSAAAPVAAAGGGGGEAAPADGGDKKPAKEEEPEEEEDDLGFSLFD